MLIIIISFIVGLITDFVWARYFRAVARHAAFYAANWSFAITLCGLFGTYLLVDKQYPSMLSFMIGGYLGTYYAILHGAPKNDVGT